MHDVAHEVIGAIALVLEDSFPNSKAVLLPLFPLIELYGLNLSLFHLKHTWGIVFRSKLLSNPDQGFFFGENFEIEASIRWELHLSRA